MANSGYTISAILTVSLNLKGSSCRCLSAKAVAPLIPVSAFRSFPDLLLRRFEDVHDVVQVVAQLLERGNGMVSPVRVLQPVIPVDDDIGERTLVFNLRRFRRADLIPRLRACARERLVDLLNQLHDSCLVGGDSRLVVLELANVGLALKIHHRPLDEVFVTQDNRAP